MKANESGCNLQRTLTFFRDLQRIHPPRAAADRLVRQCKTPTMAMRVAMKSSGLKLAAAALKLGVSESYLSRLINAKHNESGELPEWFVPAFCWATGSTLLEQVIDRLNDDREEECERATVRRLASLMTGVAA